MADVAKSGTPSLSSVLPPSSDQVTGLTAGEALAPWDAVYIKSDGKAWLATGAAANAAAIVRGYVPIAHAVGDKDVTIYFGDITLRYGAGMTPGADLYLSGATAGALADAASTGGTKKLGFVLDATRVRLFGSQSN